MAIAHSSHSCVDGIFFSRRVEFETAAVFRIRFELKWPNRSCHRLILAGLVEVLEREKVHSGLISGKMGRVISVPEDKCRFADDLEKVIVAPVDDILETDNKL